MKETISLEETLNTLFTEFENVHFPRWEELPDFEVYMDQLITLINRYLEFLSESDTPIITPAMVNNYVKLNMIPKPVKKKYDRTHIAYLIAITTLKQVLTISQVKDGIELQVKSSGLKGAYNLFCEQQEDTMKTIISAFRSKKARTLSLSFDDFNSENSAIKLAIISLFTKLVCKKILETKTQK